MAPSDRRDHTLQLRVSDAELAELEREAEFDVLDVSTWVRAIAIKEARKRQTERQVPRPEPTVKMLPKVKSVTSGSSTADIKRRHK